MSKITFSVSVSSPLPLIRSYRIKFYFSDAVAHSFAPETRRPAVLHTPARAYGTGKVRTRFYGYGNGNVTLETRCKATKAAQTTTAREAVVRYVTSSVTAKYCWYCSDIVHSDTTNDRVRCTSGFIRSTSYCVTTSLDGHSSAISKRTSPRQPITTPTTLSTQYHSNNNMFPPTSAKLRGL